MNQQEYIKELYAIYNTAKDGGDLVLALEILDTIYYLPDGKAVKGEQEPVEGVMSAYLSSAEKGQQGS